MENKKIDELIHEISRLGQSFQSYQHLLDNPLFRTDAKQVQNICKKCAKNCLELRQALLIDGVKDL